MTGSALCAKSRAMRRNLMGAAYAGKLDQHLCTDPIMEKFAALPKVVQQIGGQEARNLLDRS